MIRPTSRAVLWLALGLPVGLVVLGAAPGLWPLCLAWPLAVLGLMIGDAALIRPGRGLAVAVEVPTHLGVGEAGSAWATLELPAETERRGSVLPSLDLLLEQTGDGEPGGLVPLRPAPAPVRVALPLRPVRRGRIMVEALWQRWSGPLGLVSRSRRTPLGYEVAVLPDIRALRGEAPTLSDPEAALGPKAQIRPGDGSEFEALREHVAGLDPRHIAWRPSARHRKLLGREFRTERNDQIVLAFDTGHLMTEPLGRKTRLDHAIDSGLRLAFVALRSGDLVGSCGFDAGLHHVLMPGRGLAWFSTLLRDAAAQPYGVEETNYTLALATLGTRLRRRSLVVLFTEFSDPIGADLLVEGLRHLANRHVVVCVTLQDPARAALVAAVPNDVRAAAKAVLASDLARDRALVLDQAARLGILWLDGPAEQLPERLIARYLDVKRRGLL